MYCVLPSSSLRPLGLGLGFVYLILGALYTTRFLNLILYGLYLGVALLRLGLYELLYPLYDPPLGSNETHIHIIPAIMYKGHNQYALIIKHTSNIHFKGDILHYSTIKGFVDLVYAGI